jgi:hypothetical protein
VHRTPTPCRSPAPASSVYVVDRQRRTVELVGMIWLGL